MRDGRVQKVLRCDCGFEAAGDDEELVAQAQAHARETHDTEVSAELVLRLAKPRTADARPSPAEREQA